MEERAVYERQGFGHKSGFGDRPALVIVDFVDAFCDPEQYGGGNIRAAVARTQVLLAGAREHGLPIVFTRIVYAADAADAGAFCLKVPGLERFTEDHPAGQVVAKLAPREGEYVIRKKQPSAFFGTDCHAWLIGKRVDTVIVAGATTSGCVRATVVDAMSYNFRTIVASDCVGDRALEPHAANLFDMEQKYADLLTADEIVATLRQAPVSSVAAAAGA